MRHGGVDVARFPFDWRWIQPHRNDAYRFGGTDALVSTLARAGITLQPFLFGSPPWIHRNYRRPPIETKSARRAWRRMVRAEVTRYGPGGGFWAQNPTLPYRPITHWQVWNEPNIPGFFAPKASPKRYARLLKITAPAIRSGGPQTRVVMAGLTHGYERRRGQMLYTRYLRRLYAHGARGSFDLLADHPFGTSLGSVRKQIKTVRRIADRHGDGHKPLWIDEIGWPTSKRPGNPLTVGLKRQAELLRSAFHYVLRHRKALDVRLLEWVVWRDRPDAKSCIFCRAGLVTSARARGKPSWAAYKSFAQR